MADLPGATSAKRPRERAVGQASIRECHLAFAGLRSLFAFGGKPPAAHRPLPDAGISRTRQLPIPNQNSGRLILGVESDCAQQSPPQRPGQSEFLMKATIRNVVAAVPKPYGHDIARRMRVYEDHIDLYRTGVPRAMVMYVRQGFQMVEFAGQALNDGVPRDQLRASQSALLSPHHIVAEVTTEQHLLDTRGHKNRSRPRTLADRPQWRSLWWAARLTTPRGCGHGCGCRSRPPGSARRTRTDCVGPLAEATAPSGVVLPDAL